jgi:hypothetical protein
LGRSAKIPNQHVCELGGAEKNGTSYDRHTFESSEFCVKKDRNQKIKSKKTYLETFKFEIDGFERRRFTGTN